MSSSNVVRILPGSPNMLGELIKHIPDKKPKSFILGTAGDSRYVRYDVNNSLIVLIGPYAKPEFAAATADMLRKMFSVKWGAPLIVGADMELPK